MIEFGLGRGDHEYEMYLDSMNAEALPYIIRYNSTDMIAEQRTWFIDNVLADEYDWRLLPGIDCLMIRFKHEEDLIAFKIRFGL